MISYDVEKTPIVDLVNKIIITGVRSRASDIHFDPMEDGLKIRMRIDGNLRDHAIIPKASERNLITRIKLISGMNITENRLPQDGAIKGRIDDLDLACKSFVVKRQQLIRDFVKNESDVIITLLFAVKQIFQSHVPLICHIFF